MRQAARTSTAVDFIIITALEEELKAVLRHLPGYRKLDRAGEEPHTYYEAFVQTSRSDRARYRVLVTLLAGMGPIQAAAKATAVVDRWAPSHVLFVGIAGGLRSAVGLGDVVVANQIADYTVGKRTEERRITRWEVHRTDATLLDAVSHLPEGWEDRTKEARPVPGQPPRRYTGIILSGGDVLADGETLRKNQEIWDQLLGVEMEGGGTAMALHQSGLRPRFLMIRGVSDLADQEKDGATTVRWRLYACDVAAAYTRAFLESGPVPAAYGMSKGTGSRAGHASRSRTSGAKGASSRDRLMSHLERVLKQPVTGVPSLLAFLATLVAVAFLLQPSAFVAAVFIALAFLVTLLFGLRAMVLSPGKPLFAVSLATGVVVAVVSHVSMLSMHEVEQPPAELANKGTSAQPLETSPWADDGPPEHTRWIGKELSAPVQRAAAEEPPAPRQEDLRAPSPQPSLQGALVFAGRAVCETRYPCGASPDGATIYCVDSEMC